MLPSELKQLPTSQELPCSDDTPVDNEDQNFLPNVLLFVLNALWSNRHDWFFGVDMAIYHTTGKNPRVPVVLDGFLSLGVTRWQPSRKGRGRYKNPRSHASDGSKPHAKACGLLEY